VVGARAATPFVFFTSNTLSTAVCVMPTCGLYKEAAKSAPQLAAIDESLTGAILAAICVAALVQSLHPMLNDASMSWLNKMNGFGALRETVLLACAKKCVMQNELLKAELWDCSVNDVAGEVLTSLHPS